MDGWHVIATLRRHEDELHRQGVAHVALFGSVARGEARADSDIDILIDLDLEAGLSVFDYVDLKDYIAGLFDRLMDVVNRKGLKPYIKPTVLADVVYAF
jgi:predicted nucleotidyltransferase